MSDAWRQDDVDPSKAIFADTRKLEGNSAYGSTIMNQDNFRTWNTFVEGKATIEMNINYSFREQKTWLNWEK